MAKRKSAPKSKKAAKAVASAPAKSLYTLDVDIMSGPMTDAFVRRNRVICRTIEIRGDQTLDDLHDAIFRAFDRWEEHMYEFQFGERPHDPKGKRYGITGGPGGFFGMDREGVGDAVRKRIGSLGLEPGRVFGYWFDFGDDWWHRIEVVAIGEPEPRTKYPRLTKQKGKSPPQYADLEEED